MISLILSFIETIHHNLCRYNLSNMSFQKYESFIFTNKVMDVKLLIISGYNFCCENKYRLEGPEFG